MKDNIKTISKEEFTAFVMNYALDRDDYAFITVSGGNSPKGDIQNFHIHNIPQELPDIFFDIYEKYQTKPHKVGVDIRGGKLSVWYKFFVEDNSVKGLVNAEKG